MNLYHLTLRSSNSKTGAIPVSTSPRSTCPPECPLQSGGCYGAGGPLAIHWRAVSTGRRGVAWSEFCGQIAALPPGQAWRHNQAGDLPGNGSDIDAAKLAQLVAANRGKLGWTYTHKPPSSANLAAIRAACADGFTVNLSANNLAHADKLAELGLPVAVVLAEPGSTTTPGGRRVVQCPGYSPPGTPPPTTCSECLLCYRQQRAIVGLPVHGSSAKQAATIAAA